MRVQEGGVRKRRKRKSEELEGRVCENVNLMSSAKEYALLTGALHNDVDSSLGRRRGPIRGDGQNRHLQLLNVWITLLELKGKAIAMFYINLEKLTTMFDVDSRAYSPSNGSGQRY
jgi:hypothetical protein